MLCRLHVSSHSSKPISPVDRGACLLGQAIDHASHLWGRNISQTIDRCLRTVIGFLARSVPLASILILNLTQIVRFVRNWELGPSVYTGSFCLKVFPKSGLNGRLPFGTEIKHCNCFRLWPNKHTNSAKSIQPSFRIAITSNSPTVTLLAWKILCCRKCHLLGIPVTGISQTIYHFSNVFS